jgi:hypothetical protein
LHEKPATLIRLRLLERLWILSENLLIAAATVILLALGVSIRQRAGISGESGELRSGISLIDSGEGKRGIIKNL